MNKFLLKVSIILFFSILVLSCNKDLKNAREAILGEWLQVEPECFEFCDTIIINETDFTILGGTTTNYTLLSKDIIRLHEGDRELKYKFSNEDLKLTIYGFVINFTGERNEDLTLIKAN